MPRRVENPSNKPEMAPAQLENYKQQRDPLHEYHPSNTSKLSPKLQADSRENAQEEAPGDARTKEPVITTRGSLSPKSSINSPNLLGTVEEAIRALILPELAALKCKQGKRQRREERVIDNTYDKDMPGKVDVSIDRDQESRTPNNQIQDRSLSPLPILTEYRARRVAGYQYFAWGAEGKWESKDQRYRQFKNFFKEAPPFMEKPFFEQEVSNARSQDFRSQLEGLDTKFNSPQERNQRMGVSETTNLLEVLDNWDSPEPAGVTPRTRYSNEVKVRRSTTALVLRMAKVMSYKDLQEARAKRAAKDAANEAKVRGNVVGSAKAPRQR